MDDFPKDAGLCRQCGGLCCKGHPGAYTDPGRFLRRFFPHRQIDLPFLRAALPYLGLEMKEIGGVPVPVPRTAPWGCVHLGAAGCRLNPEERPEQCLALEPVLETLIDGEIRCNLPERHGIRSARERWQAFWGSASRN